MTLQVEEDSLNDSHTFSSVKLMCKLLIFFQVNMIAYFYDAREDTCLGCFNMRSNWTSLTAPPSSSTGLFISNHPVLMMIIFAHLGITFTSFTWLLIIVTRCLLMSSLFLSKVPRLTEEMPFARLLTLSLSKKHLSSQKS